MRPVDSHVRSRLTQHLRDIGEELAADAVTVASPIVPGLEIRLRDVISQLAERRDSIAMMLDTPGGVVEIVERMVTVVRHHYPDVTVIIPDRAMSAGTIFALSADRIMMDHLSCLGPIDPQVERDDRLVPALSYLNQFERLNVKAAEGELTTAEYALLDKLDLGELYQFEQARELSIELVIKWLSRYKFKDWVVTKTRGVAVTEAMRRERAEEIAGLLNDPERWHSHGRAIDMRTLQGEVGLRIDDLEARPALHKQVRGYFSLLRDYMHREELFSFIHTREYF